MIDEKDAETILLLNTLQEPSPKKARTQYLKTFELDEINDQAVYDLFEDRVVDAIETIVDTYVTIRQPGERFNQTYRRVGLGPFKEKLYAAH